MTATVSLRAARALLAALVLLVAAAPSVALELATLEERLEKDLRARRPQEFAFIDSVVEHVEKGKLPLSVVDSTYLWARTKQPIPFPYFERALRLRAEKLGVEL